MAEMRAKPSRTADLAGAVRRDGDAQEPATTFDAAKQRLAERESYDIVAGINCLDVETTIVHVLSAVCEGLREHFPFQRALVIVMDGNSQDQTRDLAAFYPAPRGIDKEVVIQGHGPGKGNGVRSVLEIASAVRAKACAFVDGDLISIRPGWLDYMLRPIVYGLTDLTVPYYLRDKWDGVITNHLVYPFTAALYGSSVRQPIGGEFSLSHRYIQHLLAMEDIPGDFGIDIFVTTTAPAAGFRTMEVPLGIRVHTSTIGYTDPRATLERMYQEVVGEMLDLALGYEEQWRQSGHEANVLLVESVVPYYGRLPPAVDANERLLLEIFTEGVQASSPLVADVLPKDVRRAIDRGLKGGGLDADAWIQAVYALAAQYMISTERPIVQPEARDAGGDRHPVPERERILRLLAGLGMGRYLSFVHETRGADLAEANDLIRAQAARFHAHRDLLIRSLDRLRETLPPPRHERE